MAFNSDAKLWSLYIIRCGDRSLYTGITNNVTARFATHQSGNSRSAKYLRGRAPLSLVYQIRIGSRSEAAQVEYQIKQLSKRQKEELVAGNLKLEEVGILSHQGKGKI